eukprot:TRINITY_DN7503_c0_g1_i1.p1 TRINITY_DN7503_c0_g1~~TRINITY_DN7503_c0_g1_i1.p1  ORF type:complete len:440 (-),score=32.75 TRINITY_DN7503_c0_g1_i1:48-1367(-)
MVTIRIIGAGLAGSEAAWQAAEAGIEVELCEMRPVKMTPAHHTGLFAELVCSNSLGSEAMENVGGLLKEELRRLKSLIIEAADETRIPAGGALAVDREKFSGYITERITNHPRIRRINIEITDLEYAGITIIATAPLTSPLMAEALREITGEQYLYFYDAAAPVVTADSIDMTKIFSASRYGKGSEDYLNCPMNQAEYELFWQELVNSETASLKEFEKAIFFTGCMPVEVMAARGIDTLRFGPLKPVGLIDPKNGKQPYAVVQLRQENTEASLYNIVGFQTHLKWPEQKRVFKLIAGLENAEFVRLGVMHRNTFINSPKLLCPTLQLRSKEDLFAAGQITGVEGYVESTASGLAAGINAARLANKQQLLFFPQETALGALFRYITDIDNKIFQPMNMNFGIMPPLTQKVKPVSYTHLRAHETRHDLVCRLLLEKKKKDI